MSRAALLLFAAIAVLCFAGAARAADPLHLMPESASNEADDVDGLTYLVLWITGITFVGVEGLLVIFLFKYKRKDGQKSKYTHGNHAVEMVWTVTPAAILVFLALYQMSMWLRLKRPRPEENAGATEVQVLAKQFEWNVRYPGPDGKFGTKDDRLCVAAMVVPVNHPVNVVGLRSLDVIHSFFLPNFRFKQDAVPGLTIPFWFRPTKLSADRQPVMDRNGNPKKLAYWDIVCAELCGNLHTTMGAQLYVVSDEDYAKWTKDPSSVPGLPPWQTWNMDNAMGAPDTVWVRWAWQDKQYDSEGRILMHSAKTKRDPFGKDEDYNGGGGDKKSEDM